MNRPNRRASRRGHHLPELDRVHFLVAQQLGRAEHRLNHQRCRDLARQTQQDAGLDHGLGQQGEVGRARARDGGDRVEVILRHHDHPPDVAQDLGGELEMSLIGVATGRDPGHALVHHRRGVGHGADNGHRLGQPRLDKACGDCGHDRQQCLLGMKIGRDGRQQSIDVLRLDGRHHHLGSRDGGAVVEGDVHPVGGAEVLQTLLGAGRHGDLGGRSPPGREQSGEQSLTHLAATENCQPRHERAYDCTPNRSARIT